MELGQRFKILILVPTILVLLPLITGAVIVRGQALSAIALLAAAAIACPPVGYFFGISIRHCMAATRASTRARPQ
jgi:hypothetical protein